MPVADLDSRSSRIHHYDNLGYRACGVDVAERALGLDIPCCQSAAALVSADDVAGTRLVWGSQRCRGDRAREGLRFHPGVWLIED